jgi:DNA-binding XRE family transcriptional regulator
MSYGYSIRVVEAIKNADVNHLGVQLGLACIANDISVSEAARALGITRQTVYHWFLGRVEPKDAAARVICSFLETLDKSTTMNK